MVDKEKMKELDSKWNEVVKLAEAQGFIVQSFAGVSIIATHENQVKMWGEEKYLQMQKEMYRRDMSSGGTA